MKYGLNVSDLDVLILKYESNDVDGMKIEQQKELEVAIEIACFYILLALCLIH